MPRLEPTSPTSLRSKAHRFESDTCRSAIIAANTSRWKLLCRGAPGHSRLFDEELCRGSSQMYRSGVTDVGRREVTYVRNQKAASQTLLYELAPILSLAGPARHGVTLGWVAPANASTFVLSFVRDPLDTALDGYLELRHLAGLRSLDYRAAIARAVGAGSGHAVGAGKSGQVVAAPALPPCRGVVDATRQFKAFLEAVRRGDGLGGDAYHVFPQALKLDHVGPKLGSGDGGRSGGGSGGRGGGGGSKGGGGGGRSGGGSSGSVSGSGSSSGAGGGSGSHGFDALGHVESLEADLRGMRNMLGLPTINMTALLQSRRHSHRHEACAQVDKKDRRLAALACELYAADYACFGYPTPPPCTAVGVSNAGPLGIETFSLGLGLS